MSKLRKSAKGRDCQIRIPGVCTGDSSTVVLCHLPGGGMGGKMPDLFGAFGCSACHDAVDGRSYTAYPSPTIKRWFYEAVFRTQELWLEEGLIK